MISVVCAHARAYVRVRLRAVGVPVMEVSGSAGDLGYMTTMVIIVTALLFDRWPDRCYCAASAMPPPSIRPPCTALPPGRGQPVRRARVRRFPRPEQLLNGVLLSVFYFCRQVFLDIFESRYEQTG